MKLHTNLEYVVKKWLHYITLMATFISFLKSTFLKIIEESAVAPKELACGVKKIFFWPVK